MKTLRLALLCVLGALPLHAQDQPDPTTAPAPGTSETLGPDRFWQAQLPTGHYMVALDRISSIALQEYIVDGSLLVREVTIDTNGRAIARFYHRSPVTDAMRQNGLTSLAERGRELLENAGQRAGSEVQDMVQKNYPTTTHAATIEFRLQQIEQLDALYESVRKAWTDRRGRQFSVE